MYLGHLPDYITGHTQALHEGACCHKSTRGPQAQFSRGIPERMQRLGLLAQAVQVVVRQQLGVQLLEEALQQPCPELGQRLLEVQVGPTVVEAQLSIQVSEGPSVLRIQVSKGPRENLLQCALRVIQQALEVVCAQRRGNDPLRGGPCSSANPLMDRIPSCFSEPAYAVNESWTPYCRGFLGLLETCLSSAEVQKSGVSSLGSWAPVYLGLQLQRPFLSWALGTNRC